MPGHLGLGKLISISGGAAEVALFRSVNRRDTRSWPLDVLERGFLGPETRVYVAGEEGWRIGRVKNYFRRDDGLIEYEVRFPNGRISEFLETDLDVRCWTAAEDPSSVLAAGAAESQFLHDRRRAASERLIAMHAAAQGLPLFNRVRLSWCRIR